MAAKRQWVYSPRKTVKPKIPSQFKPAVQDKADELIQSFLKPNFVKEPPEESQWNYIVDIETCW